MNRFCKGALALLAALLLAGCVEQGAPPPRGDAQGGEIACTGIFAEKDYLTALYIPPENRKSSRYPDGGLQEEYLCDETGRLTGWNHYAEGGGLTRQGVYAYDEAGRLAQATLTTEEGYTEQTFFDPDGSPTRAVGRFADGSFCEYEYSPEGYTLRETSYNADGSFCAAAAHQYDEAGRRVRTDTLAADGSLLGYRLFSYDEAGVLLYEETYTPDGSLIARILG